MPADVPLVDLIVKANRVHALDNAGASYRSHAAKNGRVVAVSEEIDGLDTLVSAGTRVLDARDLTLLPGFSDTHTHLIFAGRAVNDVPVERAGTLADLLGMIRERAASTPAGEWIRTNSAWHEFDLAERRFPTRWELDGAAPDHPVIIKRGGHNDVCSSTALRLAGIDRDTPDPAGGTIVRDETGEPTGWLIEQPAWAPVEALLSAPSREEQIQGLRLASRDYARKGLCAVRDAAVERQEMLLLHEVHERGELAVRVQSMILLPGLGSLEDRLAVIDGWGVRSGFGDDVLRLWGLKIVADGGAEAGALIEPYANRPDYNGNPVWDADEIAAVAGHAVANGWRLGTHAVGRNAGRLRACSCRTP